MRFRISRPLGQTVSEAGRDADQPQNKGKDGGSTAPGRFPRNTHGGRRWLGPFELAQHRVTGE